MNVTTPQPRITIVEAVKTVMRQTGKPLTYKEAYELIVQQGLYKFRAANPVHIVRNEIRRHAEGVEFPTASRTKHFRMVEGFRYEPLPVVRVKKARPKTHSKVPGVRQPSMVNGSLESLEESLRKLREKYLQRLERQTISALKKLDPFSFEQFSGLLIHKYGFEEVVVTKKYKDGGIDGHGKLKVGLASLNVAFQCKRYGDQKVGRPEIDRFRGASQGQYEQAIFFTTSGFTPDAIGASTRQGAIPVVLVDGMLIFQLMMDRKFGIELEPFELPVYALDKAIEEATEKFAINIAEA